MRVRFAAAAAWLAACAVFAQPSPAPTAFAGVPLGSTEAGWRAAFPRSVCGPASDRALADRTCTLENITAFGGVALTQATGSFVDDRLVRIAIVYAPRDADRVTEALAAIHGAPIVRNVSVINRRGATVPNAVARWSQPDGTIENRAVGTMLEQAALTYSVPDYVALTQRRQLDLLKPKLPTEPVP